MNPHASALGKKAKGVAKTLTDEQREYRRQQLEAARKKRWPKRKKRNTANTEWSESRSSQTK